MAHDCTIESDGDSIVTYQTKYDIHGECDSIRSGYGGTLESGGDSAVPISFEVKLKLINASRAIDVILDSCKRRSSSVGHGPRLGDIIEDLAVFENNVIWKVVHRLAAAPWTAAAFAATLGDGRPDGRRSPPIRSAAAKRGGSLCRDMR